MIPTNRNRKDLPGILLSRIPRVKTTEISTWRLAAGSDWQNRAQAKLGRGTLEVD
jgi:hypothetical protein